MQITQDALTELYREAGDLAGRPVEVVGTKDRKYIVEWFSFGEPPPPKGNSEEEALSLFISKMKERKLPDDVKDEAQV